MREVPDAIILCGGAGMRLRPVTGDGQKVMATVSGRPFLELLLKQLKRGGCQRVVLAAGYRADSLLSFFGDQALGMSLTYSIEDHPLGTGGALRQAAELAGTSQVLVLNGDSYTDIDLATFVADCQTKQVELGIVVIPANGRSDCGNVSTDGSNRVLSFAEKETTGQLTYNNAGIYLIHRDLLATLPRAKALSIERDVFPQWIEDGHELKAYVHQGKCFDIGTPERFCAAQVLLSGIETFEVEEVK